MGHVCQPRLYRHNLSSWLLQWLSSWTVQLAIGSVSKETTRFPGLRPPIPGLPFFPLPLPLPERLSYTGQKKVGTWPRAGAPPWPGVDIRNPAGRGGERRPRGPPSKDAPSHHGVSGPVLVCSGGHNNTSQNGQLKQHWFLTVPESGKFQIKKLTDSALGEGLRLGLLSPHLAGIGNSGVSSSKDRNPLIVAPPSWPHWKLIISHRPYLLTPWHWDLGLQHMNSQGTKTFSP